MGKKLTAAQIDQYTRDGFTYPIDGFGAEQAWRYRTALEKFEAAQGTEFTKGHNFKPHLLFTWVDEIVHNPAILDAVEDLIGPNIRLFHLSVWPKNPRDPAYVSWHQDATYFGLEPKERRQLGELLTMFTGRARKLLAEEQALGPDGDDEGAGH